VTYADICREAADELDAEIADNNGNHLVEESRLSQRRAGCLRDLADLLESQDMPHHILAQLTAPLPEPKDKSLAMAICEYAQAIYGHLGFQHYTMVQTEAIKRAERAIFAAAQREYSQEVERK
jgi:hypothetical protein